MRVAVFVDGDNIGAAHAERIFRIGERHGSVDLLRVYGNFSNNLGWNGALGYRPIHAGTGKNASDMLLAIDAMETAHRGDFSTFVIASSDGDFTHLAQRLRERGFKVIGAGEAKAPEAYRVVCTEFECLEVKTEEAKLVEVKPVAVKKTNGATDAKAPTQVDQKVRAIIIANSKNGLGMLAAEMSPRMNQKHKIKVGTLGYKNWREYLKARPHLYDLDPRGPEARVRAKT